MTQRVATIGFAEAYSYLVSRLLHSVAHRVVTASIAAMMLALIVTQAASSVCFAQCAQRGPATSHCRPMRATGEHGATLQICAANSFCVIGLLANSQAKIPAASTVRPDMRSDTLLPALNSAIFTNACPPVRSSVGDPPRIPPLRV